MASGLAYIDVPEKCGPLELLQNWINDFKKHTLTNFLVFNLATSSITGNVKNRHVVLQELGEDGIIFDTNLNSPKAKQIIRVEGVAEKLSRDVCERLYKSQPLFAKIRANLIIDQSVEVEWDDLKMRHDDLLEKVEKGKLELIMPDHYVAYKIVPKQFDFYHCTDEEIADRLFFKKCSAGSWSRCHITA